MRTRKLLPAYLKLPITFPVEPMLAECERIFQERSSHSDFIAYDYSGFIDLTEIDREKEVDDKTWVGVNKQWLVNQNGGQYLMNRLEYSKQKDPYINDRNHNSVKTWAQDSHLVKVAGSLGEFSRITLSWLDPSGWWPAHYDYDTTNAIKIHIPLTSNNDCWNCSWHPQEKRLVKVQMGVGEVWFLNPGFKHMAKNWGQSGRIHLVISLRSQEILENKNAVSI